MIEKSLQMLADAFGKPTQARGKFYFNSPRGKIEFCVGCGYVIFGVGQLNTFRLRFRNENFMDDFSSTLRDFSRPIESPKETIGESLDKLKLFGIETQQK